jgi:AcrR family transcriptional regulator
MSKQPRGASRRAEYAALTRRAIIDAARELFAQRGYVRTKVNDIAAHARVSPATVYAVTGGKQGLLHTLVDEWTQAPEVAEVYAAITAAETPGAVLDLTAAAVRGMRSDWGDVMRIVLATAPQDDTAAERLRVATERYRAGMHVVAMRLCELDALKSHVTVKDAIDVLWFYFGYTGFFTLLDDNGWPPEKAERWLRDAAAASLLR